MLRARVFMLPVLALFSVLSQPLAAETAPAPAAPPAAESPKAEVPKADALKAELGKTDAPPDEKRVGQMRERWRKMTPEQREEMRKKAERRLQERYDRLKPDQQGKVNMILADVDKLSREEKSILMAKIRQKAHKERLQRKMLKDMEKGESKKEGEASPVAASSPAAPEKAAH